MTAFIIATLVYFVLSLGLGLLQVALGAGKSTPSMLIASAINVIVSLMFITWSIILLAS